MSVGVELMVMGPGRTGLDAQCCQGDERENTRPALWHILVSGPVLRFTLPRPNVLYPGFSRKPARLAIMEATSLRMGSRTDMMNAVASSPRGSTTPSWMNKGLIRQRNAPGLTDDAYRKKGFIGNAPGQKSVQGRRLVITNG